MVDDLGNITFICENRIGDSRKNDNHHPRGHHLSYFHRDPPTTNSRDASSFDVGASNCGGPFL